MYIVRIWDAALIMFISTRDSEKENEPLTALNNPSTEYINAEILERSQIRQRLLVFLLFETSSM